MRNARNTKLAGPKDAELRQETIAVKLRPDEKMTIVLACQKTSKSVSEYCRELLLKVAREELDKQE